MKRLVKWAAIIAAFVILQTLLIIWIFHPEGEAGSYLRDLVAETITFLVINGYGFWTELFILDKEFKILIAGWSFDRVTNFIFEWVIYPFVIRVFGLLYGGLIMVLVSIAGSLIVIRFYDKTKKDWLGFEKVKAAQEAQESKAIRWFLRKSKWVAVIGLSFLSEPTKITLYMRKGVSQYNGFAAEDWVVFFTSVLVSNIIWALAVFGGWKIFDWALN